MTDEQKAPEWPQRISVFSHGSSERCYEIGQQLGLEGEELRLFSHAMDEYKLTMLVNKDGTAKVIAMDDKPLLDNQMSHHYSDAVQAIEEMKKRKDFAYMERNMLVAHLASMYPSGTRKTDIPGWDPEWHGCVYIDTPAGQMSWHYHDSQAAFFEGLPPYTKPWDGHTTEQKYERLGELRLINMGFGDAQRKDIPSA